MNNIILCGFMGCGKSTIGKIIAKKTGKKFIDMDSYIEEKAEMKISEIFEKFGEASFRDMEHEACRELSEMKGMVIASGGGAFTFDRNVEVFKGKDKIVFLNVALATIKYRLRNDKVRPLLQRPDKDKAIQELYNKRFPIYKKAADIIVEGKNTPVKTAFAVMDAINLQKI